MGYTTLSQWDFQNSHVTDIPMNTGTAISSKSAIIGVGPRVFATAATEEVRLVGAVASITHGQAKQIQQLMEIGSELPITITGRTRGSVSIASMMFNGPSLLKALTQFSAIDDSDYANTGKSVKAIFDEIQATEDAAGYDDFFINLASRIFDIPIGILIMLRTNMGSNYGAAYLENGLIASHNWSFTAGGNILSEGVSITYERVVPVNVTGLPSNV